MATHKSIRQWQALQAAEVGKNAQQTELSTEEAEELTGGALGIADENRQSSCPIINSGCPATSLR